MYGEYSTHHQSQTHMRMWRTSRWKLVRDFLNPDRDELYDLRNDTQELVNVIDRDDAETQQALAELSAKILARMDELADPVRTEIP